MIAAPLAPPAAGTVEVELLSQTPALRTALRRALRSRGAAAVLSDAYTAERRAAGGQRARVIDADMPGLSGTALLERISAADSTMPVVVVACDTARGRGLKDRAMRAGAAAVVIRPEADQPFALKDAALEVVDGILKGPRRKPAPSRLAAQPAAPRPAPRRVVQRPSILVVGSSTGGPQALVSLFGAFAPRGINIPVLIVQHMPAAFTPILADHLCRSTEWTAREAVEGEPLTPGEIRIAPGGYHMVIAGGAAKRRLTLTEDPPVNFCRPSVDVLFISAASQFGASALALVLTGMGNDGAQGGRAIKAAGGTVFAQDEETSVVWGMPGAAVAAGIVDQVLPLPKVAGALRTTVTGKPL
ncbi:MAG: chemotaxis protein CheB [Pseudomonadota bacterium]